MKKFLNRLIFTALVVAFIGLGASFAYNLYGFVRYWMDERAALGHAAVMQDIFHTHITDLQAQGTMFPGETQGEEPTEVFISPLPLAREKTGNDNIVAYIHIEGTNISNVVMHYSDNAFYLNHDMYRNPNVNGSLFLDYANSPNFGDRNSIIYGHNMRNGTKFHDLRHFMNRDYFNDHRFINIITDTGVLTYEAFAAFQARTYFEYIQVYFQDDDDFQALLDELQARSVHNTDISPSVSDRILILSTCTNTAADARFVIAAKLICTGTAILT